ncbi:MAG: FAD:protein FMN transferase [Lachnospiraceae bacterium]
MKKKGIAAVGVLFMAALIFLAYKQQERTVTKSGFYFDTVIQVTLYHGETDLLDGCFQLADQYESYFSTTKENSDIKKINEAENQPVKVHPETVDLIQKGLAFGKTSDGRFDITIGALSSLWNFSENSGVVPDSKKIEAALQTVDYRKVKIDGTTVALEQKGAKIDLGGIAKGYIADQMKAYLVKHGVKDGLINLGGNVLTIGDHEKNGYHIGIQKPFDENGVAAAAVTVKDQTVVSSGVYQRYFYVGKKLYHHLLDTASGYPIDNHLQGVSVICDQSVNGDAYSTIAFSLGLKDGMKFVEQTDGLEAIFLTDDGKVHTSSGIGEKIPIDFPK